MQGYLGFRKNSRMTIRNPALQIHLEKMECHPNGFELPPSVENMWDLYKEYWLPFGQLLTDMESAGVLVNREHLAVGEVRVPHSGATALSFWFS